MNYYCYFVPIFRQEKLFITSLILNEFSCSEVQKPCLCNQQTNVQVFYVTGCSFIHNLKQRLLVFARGCVENTTSIGTALS